MSAGHRELYELATILPLGVLDAGEEQQVQRHLSEGCAECERALRESAATLDALVQALPPLEPSPELRARLLARAEAERPARARQSAPAPVRRRSWSRYALAASLLLAAALGVQVGRQREALDAAHADVQRRQQELAASEAERTRLAGELGSLRGELTSLQGMVADLTAQQTRVVALAGAGPAPAAAGRAYLDPESRRLVLMVYELPPLPAGQSYQLWVISEGEPISAGVFEITPAGTTRYETTALSPELSGPLTIAVTIEPQGGLPKPSGPIVLAGS
jgi:hypothetical protein